MVMEYVFGIVTVVLLVLYINKIITLKKRGLDYLEKGIKKGVIFFLESPVGIYLRVPETIYENVAFFKDRTIALISPGSVKRCPELGNVAIAHGDLQMVPSVPVDFKKYIELECKNMSVEEIVKRIEDIQNGNYKLPKGVKTVDNAQEWQIYKTINYDNVYNFINQGLSRTNLRSLIVTLVKEQKIGAMFGGRNWLMIAIALAVIFVVGAIAVKILLSSGILNMFASQPQAVVHATK